jgi:hypothetical protein
VERYAREQGDADLARWASDLRAAADRADAAGLTAILGRPPGAAARG